MTTPAPTPEPLSAEELRRIAKAHERCQGGTKPCAQYHMAIELEALRTENAELREALNQQGHIAEFREDGWSLEHPLECRATGLIDCPVNRACVEQSPPALGRFHVAIDEEGFLVILRASTPEGSQEVRG